MRSSVGEETFGAWGWRVPFLVSILLLAVSVWIRLKLHESPVFERIKAEGKTSKAPLTEAFGQWKNLRIVLLALFGLTMGQAVVWYTGQFYTLFFLTQTLKVDGTSANIMVAVALLIGTPFFLFFGSLSDKIGRKPIIMAGCLIAALSYFPLFHALAHYTNPTLEAATVEGADQRDCQSGRVLVPVQPGGDIEVHELLRYCQERVVEVRLELRERGGASRDDRADQGGRHGGGHV